MSSFTNIMKIDIRTPDELLVDLGAGIRAKRLHLNMSQDLVAKKAGLHRVSVASLEAGRSSQVTTLVRVLHAIGASRIIDDIAPKETVSPIAIFREETKPQRQRAGKAR